MRSITRQSERLGSWLGSFKEVKGLVVLGHAGEGTFSRPGADRSHRKLRQKLSTKRFPLSLITLEGKFKVAALEAKRAVGGRGWPGWFIPRTAGCGSAIRRERRKTVIAQSTRKRFAANPVSVSGPTKATYNLETQLDIARCRACSP